MVIGFSLTFLSDGKLFVRAENFKVLEVSSGEHLAVKGLFLAPHITVQTIENAGINFVFACVRVFCSDFRYESNGIFVLGVGFFFFRQISTF